MRWQVRGAKRTRSRRRRIGGRLHLVVEFPAVRRSDFPSPARSPIATPHRRASAVRNGRPDPTARRDCNREILATSGSENWQVDRIPLAQRKGAVLVIPLR